MDRSQIPARLSEIRARIGDAAARAGRSAKTVRLIAVSKTFPFDAVRAAADAGQTDFGENRVQEALQKIALSTEMQIRWHLIGHLQSNKAKKAVEGFAAVHSVDSSDLLRRLDMAAVAAGKTPDCLIQVDLALEETKHGAPLDQVPQIFDAASKCEAVRVRGLMLLPPWADDPEFARPWFRQLRQLRDALVSRGVAPEMLSELSMGMSHDFEVAIEEGATMVRIGTAIFGSRS